ncbi:hypothetical protein [Pseudomonas aeruginosa]|uniref:hypothetical protein n=1 Tax=Pseudomonas aeruginosa TaxID=287 RepID=UPI00157A27E4|nr:hypothetical protein [Pseudomonas aeruginosa]
MTEATNIWTATANEITNAVRESLIAMGCGEPQTGDVYDQLLLIGRSGVEGVWGAMEPKTNVSTN